MLAIVAATINPEDYKPQIVQLVKDKTQRNLTLAGKIHLTFFPGLGIELGKASLSEQSSDGEFAVLGNVRLYLAWWPLLHKQVVVNHVRVDGLKMNLVRYKNGSTNFADLLQNRDASSPFKFDIDGLQVLDSAIDWRDDLKNQHLVFTDLKFQADRLANAVPGDIALRFRAVSAEPKLDVQAAISGRLLFDTQRQHYALANTDARLDGTVLSIAPVTITLRGDIDVNLEQQAFALGALAISAASQREKNSFNIKLDVPAIAFTQDQVNGGKVQLTANFQQGPDKTEVSLNVPGFEGNSVAFKAGDIVVLNWNAKFGEQSITGNMASPLNGNWLDKKIVLPQITGKLIVSDNASPILNTGLTGDAQADWAKQRALLNFAAQFDDTHVVGKVGLDAFLPPLYAFDIDIDKLDADRYLSKKSPKKTAAPFDLTVLKGINANGVIHIGALKFGDTRSSNIKLELKAAESNPPTVSDKNSRAR